MKTEEIAMAMIDYTQFIGIRAAENSIGTTTFNSTNYSMLIVYTNGAREIVEGSASEMRPFLPYLKEDNTAQILRDSLAKLEANLERMVDERIERIFRVSHPIPDVVGLQEEAAIARLKAAGFVVRLLHTYPEGIPQGIVRSCTRVNNDYLTVELDVRHDLPKVEGLPEEDAILLLERAGFTVRLTNTYPEGVRSGKVYACRRETETSMVVLLDVRHDTPDVVGLPEAEARALLEAAGFNCSMVYKDPFKLSYNVTEVVRSDPRKLDVTLWIASREIDAVGRAEAEARQVFERMGQNVVVERVLDKTAVPGTVVAWRMQDGSVVLRVCASVSEIATEHVTCRVRNNEGVSADCRKLRAVYNPQGNALEITLEMAQSTRNRYSFGSYCGAAVDQKNCFNSQVTMPNSVMEPEQWCLIKLHIGGAAESGKLPEQAVVQLYSTYGVFKKDAAWKLEFSFKW